MDADFVRHAARSAFYLTDDVDLDVDVVAKDGQIVVIFNDTIVVHPGDRLVITEE